MHDVIYEGFARIFHKAAFLYRKKRKAKKIANLLATGWRCS